jgi:hypothetical protein
VVVRDLAKVEARVRFPYPAPVFRWFRNNSIFPTGLAQFRVVTAPIRCGAFPAVLEFPLLAPMLAYLCGPIEFANGGGKLWRRKLAPFLREQLGHRLYDPAEDEKKNLTDEEMTHFREWKSTEPERFRRAVRKIIHFDLDLIENKADYLICYWDDPTNPSGGTPAELTAAFRKGIPVYLVTPLAVDQVSGWMLGCADQIFTTVEQLKEFLARRYGREKQTQLWKE